MQDKETEKTKKSFLSSLKAKLSLKNLLGQNCDGVCKNCGGCTDLDENYNFEIKKKIKLNNE